ncbi:uncharacterized protein LOC134780621 [Penaeus indicus]|uniref:uncharacterized protein LOC134780621 n=1 Tax=Penaeus indicus TaxID=29960 RepID=UPI00300CF20D
MEDCNKVLIIIAATSFVLMLGCSFVVFWLFRRYSAAKECLLLLRRLDLNEPRKRRLSLRPPSCIAPPLPPKRTTPNRSGMAYRPPDAPPASDGESSPESFSYISPDVLRASVIQEEEEEEEEESSS